jgi:segregation and condensation protein A
MSFLVKQQSFEGPLDLLLSLIEKRKLFINDISLAKVADDYIAHVRQFEQFPIGDSANFILIASTLLLIKSKSLLPNLSLTEEEQGDIEDLELRLKIYQRIKDASVTIKNRFGKQFIFAKSNTRIITPVFSPDASMTLASLVASIREVLKNLPKKEIIPKAIVRKVISLEESILHLTERIKSSLKMSFKEFAGMGKQEKVNVIVSFLAMLELFKQGVIHVTQHAHTEDITIETKDIGVPRYE